MDSLSLLNQQQLPSLGADSTQTTPNLDSSSNPNNPTVKVDGVQLLEQMKAQFDQAYNTPQDDGSKLTFFATWSAIMVMADNVFKTGKLHTEMKNYQNKGLEPNNSKKMTASDMQKLDKEMDKFISQAKAQKVGNVTVHWSDIAGVGSIYTDYKATPTDNGSNVNPMGAVVLARSLFNSNMKNSDGQSMDPQGAGTKAFFSKLANGTPEQQNQFRQIQRTLENLNSDLAYKGFSGTTAENYDDTQLAELTSLYAGKNGFLNNKEHSVPSDPNHTTSLNANNLLLNLYHNVPALADYDNNQQMTNASGVLLLKYIIQICTPLAQSAKGADNHLADLASKTLAQAQTLLKKDQGKDPSATLSHGDYADILDLFNHQYQYPNPTDPTKKDSLDLYDALIRNQNEGKPTNIDYKSSDFKSLMDDYNTNKSIALNPNDKTQSDARGILGIEASLFSDPAVTKDSTSLAEFAGFDPSQAANDPLLQQEIKRLQTIENLDMNRYIPGINEGDAGSMDNFVFTSDALANLLDTQG